MRKLPIIPKPRFDYGDIVLAPRWRFGVRKFVIATIEGSEYVFPGGRYTREGYSAGWIYKISSGRKVWWELYEPRLRLLAREADANS